MKRRGRERAIGNRRSVYTHTGQHSGETGATAQLSPSSTYGAQKEGQGVMTPTLLFLRSFPLVSI